jgi:hypothetical protein
MTYLIKPAGTIDQYALPLTDEDIVLIHHALSVLRSDYEGTSELPTEKLNRVMHLMRMFA